MMPLKSTLNNSDLIPFLTLKKKFLMKVLKIKLTMLLNLLLPTGQNTKNAHSEDFMNNLRPSIPTSRMKFTMMSTQSNTSFTNKLIMLLRKLKINSTTLLKKLKMSSTTIIMRRRQKFHPSQWKKFKP